MSQCIARTKDFERCRNNAETGSIFCRRHRWWWLLALTGVVVTATTVGANIATMFGATFPNPFAATMVPIETPSITMTPLAAGLVFDEFNANQGFQSTSSQVEIYQGKILWNVNRSGGEQYLYREIPAFRGDVRLTVVGQVNDWTNNCAVGVGIGDRLGSGIAIKFGYYGGGCATSGTVITALGATLDMQESYCSFSGDWLWISPNTPTHAELTTDFTLAELAVERIGKAEGVVSYVGDYKLLWIGMTGNGDWPSCSGEIHSIKIEPLE